MKLCIVVDRYMHSGGTYLRFHGRTKSLKHSPKVTYPRPICFTGAINFGFRFVHFHIEEFNFFINISSGHVVRNRYPNVEGWSGISLSRKCSELEAIVKGIFYQKIRFAILSCMLLVA